MSPTPEENAEAKHEAELNQAVGMTARAAFGSLVSSPKVLGVVIALLVGTGAAREVIGRGPAKTDKDIYQIIKSMRKDLIVVKVQTSAFIQTMPKAQRIEADKIIEMQMSAIRMAEEKP